MLISVKPADLEHHLHTVSKLAVLGNTAPALVYRICNIAPTDATYVSPFSCGRDVEAGLQFRSQRFPDFFWICTQTLCPRAVPCLLFDFRLFSFHRNLLDFPVILFKLEDRKIILIWRCVNRFARASCVGTTAKQFVRPCSLLILNAL